MSVGQVRIFESAHTRRKFIAHALIVIAVGVLVFFLIRQHLSFIFDAREARETIRGFGIAAPLVLIALQAVQVVFAPVPGQVLAVVAGYLFGAWAGTLYNMIGITIGSTIAFWLSRRYGRSYVEDIVDDEALARFDSIDDRHAIITLFVLFLFPGLPDDVLCFAGGLTRIPLWQLVTIAVAGRAPAFFLVNVIGELVELGFFLEAGILAVVFTVLSGLVYLLRDRIFALFESD